MAAASSFTETAASLRLGGADARLDGGLNVCDPPHMLDPSQAAAAENVWFADGALRRRPGFTAAGVLGTLAAVDTLYHDEHGRVLIQSNSHLYSYMLSSGMLTDFYTLQIPEGMSKAPRGSFLPYNDGYVYFINGVEYIRWDGTAVETVSPCAPRYRVYKNSDLTNSPEIERNPANLLTKYVTIEYQLAQSTTVSRLTLPPEVRFDVDPIAVTYNGVALTGYSHNSNYVNLPTSYSAAGTTFHVITELRPLFTPDDRDILSCVYAADYGPEGRVFLCGNGSNLVFGSASFDPTYFPADGVRAFGPGEALTGFGKLYGTLVVFRPHGIAEVEFTDATFELRTINPVIGCDIPGSIQTLGNRLVWGNTYAGIHMLVSTSREKERNVQNVSRNIDPLLLAESDADLEAAASIDFGGRYWLNVGSRVYLWDYTNRPYTQTGGAAKCAWYSFSGISASHFFSYDDSLYFIARENDAIRRFEDRGDDAGAAFPAKYRTGALDGGYPDRFKHLDTVRLTVLRDTASQFTVSCRCDEMEQNLPVLCPEIVGVPASQTALTRTVSRPLRRRGIVTFSLEFAMPGTVAGMALSEVEIRYRTGLRIVRF
ncbi:MAG: hypothetical protein VB111_05510 [Clostridiaceae bacterium]|nr:hypothetical protein [Clostridiaceae bacterium]